MAFNDISSLCFLLLITTFLTIKCMKLFRSNRRVLLELVPGPPRLPFIGNLAQLRHMPHRTLQKLARSYGPLMYVQLGQIPALVVSSPEIAQEVLKTQDLTFCTRPTQSKLRMIYYGNMDIAFTPYNDYWRQARKICHAELLTEQRVQSFRSTREEEVEILVDSISRRLRSGTGGLVDVSDALLCFVDGIMSWQLFGKRFTAKGDGSRSRFHRLIHEFALLMGHFNIAEYFPSLDWIDAFTGARWRFEANFGEIDELLEEVIKMHEEGREKLEACMTGVLLELNKDPLVEILSRGSVKGILMDLFIAGTDPIFAAMDWGMSELIKNPRVMAKAQQEMRAVVGTKPLVEEIDLPKLPYLRQVIREILRLHPPGPFLLPRESRNSCRLSGYEIPAKTRVVINVWALGRNPNSWENPEEFYPERFNADSRDFRGKHFDLLPLGSGRRGCPGAAFAAAVLELALANILHAFDWSLPGERGMGREHGLSLGPDMEEVYGIVVHRKNNLLLRASPRTTTSTLHK